MNSDPEISEAMLKANPHIFGLMLLFGLVVLLMFTGFFFFWMIALSRWFRGASVLTIEPWKPRSWGLIDVLLVLGAAFLGQAIMIPAWASLSGQSLREMAQSDRISLSIMAVGSSSYLLAMLLGLGWLVIRYAASVQHMGLSLRRLIPNAGIGLAAAAMTLPIVALISFAVSQGLKAEYDHPLIDELKREGTFSAYLLAVFCAVGVAPLVEEFFFRVMLQGWLQSVPWSGGSWWWLLGSNASQSTVLMAESTDAGTLAAGAPSEDLPAPVPVTTELLGQVSAAGNPYDPPVLSTEAGAMVRLGQIPSDLQPLLAADAKPPVWPAFVVGTLFGLAHFDYGLSFIPLIILGIVLGLLYRAKHSIWPCFVLHFALNSISMASLGITLLIEAAK